MIAVKVLPKVHGEILMAHDRMRGFARCARQLRQRLGLHQQVLARRKRNGDAGHARQLGAPDAATNQRLLALDAALRSEHRAHTPAADLKTCDGRVAIKLARLQRAHLRSHVRHSIHRFCKAIAHHIERAVNFAHVHQRIAGVHLGRREQGGLQAVRLGVAVAALEVVQALPRVRHLQAASHAKTRLAIRLAQHIMEQVHRVLGQLAHCARCIGLEYQPRRMRC